MIYWRYMNKYYQKHIIQLSDQKYQHLYHITQSGNNKAWTIKRALILLKSNNGYKDADIAQHLDCATRTVERVRKRYNKGGIERALYDAPRLGSKPVLDAKAESYLIATACSTPPEGQARWTLELLREKLLKDKVIKHISTVAIGKHLKERGIKPWREKNVVHTKNRQTV